MFEEECEWLGHEEPDGIVIKKARRKARRIIVNQGFSLNYTMKEGGDYEDHCNLEDGS